MRNEGFRVAVLNPRGMEIPLIGDEPYDIADTVDDISTVVKHIKSQYPTANLYLLGNSMGASFGIQYLSRRNTDKNVKGMVSIGNPFDVGAANSDLSRWVKLHYGKYVTNCLIAKAKFNVEAVKKYANKHKIDIDMSSVARARTPVDFDDRFTLKLHKYASLDTYYDRLSCVNDIKRVNVPLMVIHSKNDPICS